MVYENVFNLFILVMEIAVIAFAAITIMLAITLAIIHRRNLKRERQQAALRTLWQKTFRSVFQGGPPPALPPLAERDRYSVLLIFSAFRELRQSDRDSAVDYGAMLDKLARTLKLDTFAQALFKTGDDSDRILALTVLGQMQDPSAGPTAMTLIGHPGIELSQTAAQYVLRLDPQRLNDVMPQICYRDDWVPARVERMLREAGTARVDAAMEQASQSADDRGKLKILEFAGCCSEETARQLCFTMIRESMNPEVIAAAFRALAPYARPEDGALARKFSEHQSPFVCLAALRVLQSIADEKDFELFERLAANPEWWVRHRAAQALVALCHGNSRAQQAAGSHSDPFARDAIAQALSEYRLGLNDAVISDDRATQRGPEARA